MRRNARREPIEEPGLPRLRRSRDDVRGLIEARLSAAKETAAAIEAARSDDEGYETFVKWRELTCRTLKAAFDRDDVADDFSGRVSPGHVVMSQESYVQQIA